MNNILKFPASFEASNFEYGSLESSVLKGLETIENFQPTFPQLDKLNWSAEFGQYAMLTNPNEAPQLIPAHKSRPIFRNDTKEWIGQAGSKYTIAQNWELREVLQEACENALPKSYLSEITLNEKMSHGGGFTQFSVRFVNSGKEIRQLAKNAGYSKLWNGGDKTLLNLGFSVTNSFGGKSPVVVKSLVTDLACENGMVLDVMGGQAKRRHTSGYTPEYFIPFIEEQVAKYEKRIAVWEAWAQAKITPAQAQETLEGMGIAAGLTEKLMGQLDVEAQSRGYTIWGLHSCLTHWSSHDTPEFKVVSRGEEKDIVAQALDRRQNQVSTWLASPAWQALTGEAA